MQTFHIPTDQELHLKVDESFHLYFDEDGTFGHDDHPANYAHPKMPTGSVKTGPDPTQYRAKKKGTVKCDFTPKRGGGVRSFHTILIDN